MKWKGNATKQTINETVKCRLTFKETLVNSSPNWVTDSHPLSPFSTLPLEILSKVGWVKRENFNPGNRILRSWSEMASLWCLSHPVFYKVWGQQYPIKLPNKWVSKIKISHDVLSKIVWFCIRPPSSYSGPPVTSRQQVEHACMIICIKFMPQPQRPQSILHIWKKKKTSFLNMATDRHAGDHGGWDKVSGLSTGLSL